MQPSCRMHRSREAAEADTGTSSHNKLAATRIVTLTIAGAVLYKEQSLGCSHLSAGLFLLLKIDMHLFKLWGRLALGQTFSGFHHLHQEHRIIQGLSFLMALNTLLLQLQHR